jgi:hypothetical protein
MGDLKARLVEELRELVRRYPANRFYREALDRIEVLEKALEPFALAADDLDDDHGDYAEIWEAAAAMAITAGQLRAARTALQGVSDHG